MKYLQPTTSPTNYHQPQTHIVRPNGSALCGRVPQYGWDPYEFKREDVSCKMCQRYTKLVETKSEK